jgi:F-type H+-transporting ATPase subunit b
MIDINISLLIQLANFIVLLIVLHLILFKPIRQIMQEREQNISSAFSDAKAAQERMQNLLEQYNGSLAEAKQKATNQYNSLYQQGLDAQRDMIAAERSKSGELLDKARGEIAAASAAARDDLRKEAERLSQDISAKLLGRAV